MRSIGFHLSKDILRFVILDGLNSSPNVFAHERRPLQILKSRPEFLRNALNLFESIITQYSPDTIAYVLTMSANSQEQVAGLALPLGALNIICANRPIDCKEMIAQNFSKNFFLQRGAVWDVDKYKSADRIFGRHPPNWTNNERLAALAAWSAM